MRYPAVDDDHDLPGRSGDFESLTQYIVCGFDKSNNEVTALLKKDVSTGSLLYCSRGDVGMINRLSNITIGDNCNYHTMVVYLSDFIYHLSIGHADNVRVDVWFDTCVNTRQ